MQSKKITKCYLRDAYLLQIEENCENPWLYELQALMEEIRRRYKSTREVQSRFWDP